MTEGFHFETWLEEAQSGLNSLRAVRVRLETEREDLEKKLTQCDAEIAALEKMLEAHGTAPAAVEEPALPKRVTGIKKASIAVAEELTCGVTWGEDQLVNMVQGKVPGAPEKSVRRAIQSLAKDGVLIRNGHTRNWSYSTTIGKTPGSPQEPEAPRRPSGVAPPPAKQESAQEPPEQGSLLDVPEEPSPPEVVVVGTAEVIVAVEKEMKRKKQISVGEKNIGWIAADLHCEPKVVRDALKTMVEGDYEFAYEGETKVLRRKAEPGSKEELKRTSIQDQPLFPDADRPPHA